MSGSKSRSRARWAVRCAAKVTNVKNAWTPPPKKVSTSPRVVLRKAPHNK